MAQGKKKITGRRLITRTQAARLHVISEKYLIETIIAQEGSCKLQGEVRLHLGNLSAFQTKRG